MPEPVTIGKVSVLAVQDAPVNGSRPHMFPQITEEQWEPWRHYLNRGGNLRMNIGSFVVRSEGKLILIDTGLGDKPREGYPLGNLLANLAAVDLTPQPPWTWW